MESTLDTAKICETFNATHVKAEKTFSKLRVLPPVGVCWKPIFEKAFATYSKVKSTCTHAHTHTLISYIRSSKKKKIHSNTHTLHTIFHTCAFTFFFFKNSYGACSKNIVTHLPAGPHT